MHELSEKGGSKKIKQFEKDLEVAEKRIAEIDSVIMKLFEQNALGKDFWSERFEMNVLTLMKWAERTCSKKRRIKN